ncbi:MAG: ABC transporter substrate-binding protein [Eubacteriales bacterium]|nr:ABC transporter substrate-binding protein [Eubacteriales bacterium]
MRIAKRIAALLAASTLVMGQTAWAGEGEPKILHIAESFAYPSLDAHVEYYGWYTSMYGVTESLFRIGDDSSIQPCLAEKAEADESGLVWTVTLKDGVCFSNGNPLTADMVIQNIQRLAEKNERFAYLNDFQYEAVDDKTFTITTEEVYPTMTNTLASPEMAMMDLEGTQDFDNAPVGTGPFVIQSFEPEGTVTVDKNDAYWDGEVKLDGAVIYYMQDDDSKLMAMQNGEIDGYGSVTAAALEIFGADPAAYQVTTIPATRLQFYILNENTLSDGLREAVNLTVDCTAIAEYLNNTVVPAVGPFGEATPYGKVSKPAPDAEAAKALIEGEGYTLNGDGIYEKDGEPLCLNICYYAARSLDTIAIVMQEQLKQIGIDSVLTCEEDPDSTYIATGDFDIALYCMIADKDGDPYYFINSTLRDGSYYDCGGFDDEECEALIDELEYETDADKRADLANQIVQIAIDDNAFGYVGLFSKTTVMRTGVSGISETCPFDFYRLNADTDME